MTPSSPFISSCTRGQLARRRTASQALFVLIALLAVIGSFLAGYGAL